MAYSKVVFKISVRFDQERLEVVNVGEPVEHGVLFKLDDRDILVPWSNVRYCVTEKKKG